MRALTKIETVSKEAAARVAIAQRLTVERPFGQRKFRTGTIVPCISSYNELNIAIENGAHCGAYMSQPFVSNIVRDRLSALNVINLKGERVDGNAFNLFSGCISIDPSPYNVYYRDGWESFRAMLARSGHFTDFINGINSSFAERGADIDKQSGAWRGLVNNERMRVSYTTELLKGQASFYSFYLSNGLPMITRDNFDEMTDVAVELNKTGLTLSQAYQYPYQLSLSLHENVTKSSKFTGRLIKMIQEENRFGSEFESVSFNFPNERIHSSSLQRENLSKILDMLQQLRERNKTTFLMNVDPAMALVAVHRGVDVVGVPLSGSLWPKRSKAKDRTFIAKGGYLNFMNLEQLPHEYVYEKFLENGGRLPHSCYQCKRLTELNMDVNTLAWNTMRKAHAGNCMTELNDEISKELEKQDGSLWVGVSDRIDRSNYQNYRDLIRRPSGLSGGF